MPYKAERLAHFKTLAGMRAPRFAVVVAWMVTIGIAIAVAIMALVPWLQTASGFGQVVALDPDERQQQVTALVPGRVDRWYVKDGQRVARGDPIARVVDLDPDLLSRLAAERAQVQAEIASVEQSRAVAGIDVARTRQLLAEGLGSRRDYEQTQIKVADTGAKLAESRAKLNRIDIALNRQSAQVVRAPRDGRLQQLNAASGSAMVSAGTVLAVVAPERVERAVEVFVRAQRLQLGSPQQPLRTLRIVDRLLAESVADQRQQTLLPIPERDGEHANQSPKRVFNAPPSKTFEHHLRVGRAAPCHARQFGAQLAVVVDLAVVGDDEAAVRGHHRLVPRR